MFGLVNGNLMMCILYSVLPPKTFEIVGGSLIVYMMYRLYEIQIYGMIGLLIKLPYIVL